MNARRVVCIASKRWFSVGNVQHMSSTGVLFQDLRQQLPAIVTQKRQAMKDLRTTYGKKSLGETQLIQLLDGGSEIPALYSEWQPNHAKTSNDFHTILKQTTTNTSQTNTYESMIWYFLTHGHIPTSTEVSTFTQDLQTRRKEVLQQINISEILFRLQLLPSNTRGRVYLSMILLMLQPTSHFYQHRRETKKPDQYQVIFDDILTICAILPDLLAIVNSLPTKQSEAGLHLGQGVDHITTLLHACSGENHDEMQEKVAKKMLEAVGQSLDGGLPLLHIPRLVSCTLSDPFLATSAMLHAYSTTYPEVQMKDNAMKSEYDIGTVVGEVVAQDRKNIALSEGIAITAKVTTGLFNVFWDRCLMHSLENPKSLDYTSVMEFQK